MAQTLDQGLGKMCRGIQEHPDNLRSTCSMGDWSKSHQHGLRDRLPRIEWQPPMFRLVLVLDHHLLTGPKEAVVPRSTLKFLLRGLVIDPRLLVRRRDDMDEIARTVTNLSPPQVHPSPRGFIRLVSTKLMPRHLIVLDQIRHQPYLHQHTPQQAHEVNRLLVLLQDHHLQAALRLLVHRWLKEEAGVEAATIDTLQP